MTEDVGGEAGGLDIDLSTTESPTFEGNLRPKSAPYNRERDREQARSRIAYWLIGILSAVILFVGAIGLLTDRDLDQLTTVFVTPIVGLVGTVLGFYYGGDA